MRYFKIAKGFFDLDKSFIPERQTACSAGYDIKSAKIYLIRPLEITFIATGIKVAMPKNEFLMIALRSSLAKKKLLMLNGVGIIDADYYGNPENDGAIVIPVINLSAHCIRIAKGERIAQGIFLKYDVVKKDLIGNGKKRISGLGSTGK